MSRVPAPRTVPERHRHGGSRGAPELPFAVRDATRVEYRQFRLVDDDGSLLRRHSGDEDGVFYPLADRAAVWSDRGPEELLRHLTTNLLSYAGGSLDDDMAVIAIVRVPVRADSGARVGSTQSEERTTCGGVPARDIVE